MNRLSGKKAGNKQWVHPSEALLKGHIVYNVKFLGHVEVDQPKGADVVKDAIRKMKFNKHLKKAEGQKPPKVELTISVDGVTVQEPKHKIVQHKHQLHRISYCADDKTDKKMFTFIAKDSHDNKHHCFVFDSEKCAEEITLTIGQAFDLAYKKFLDTSSKNVDSKKQFLLMQKKVQQLTQENLQLKARVADLERLIEPNVLSNLDKNKNNIINTSPADPDNPVVGRRLENLLLEDSQPQTNGSNGSVATSEIPIYASVQRTQAPSQPPMSPTTGTPILAPPPPIPTRSNSGGPMSPTQQAASTDKDLFGATPFTQATAPPVAVNPAIPPRIPPATAPVQDPFSAPSGATDDPFGMGIFNPPSGGATDLNNEDKELMDLQSGFSQGISFGTDFSLADLDPLN